MPVDFGDRTDFENAERGLVDRLASGEPVTSKQPRHGEVYLRQ
jgi:hypothetical protein